MGFENIHFQEGIKAYKDGKYLSDNPYSEHQHYKMEEWENGFRYEEDRTGG